MKKKIFLCFFLVDLTNTLAQDVISTLDLEEVTVWGEQVDHFSYGSKIVSVNETKGNSIADQIQNIIPVYFKEYGNGQLTTVTLRGLSASHTSILWNGLPVNSPTLGQFDFSIWPAFFTEKIAVHYGNSSSLYGSAALGGTVIIDNSWFQKDSILTTQLGFGSFGNNQARTKILLHGNRLSSQSKIFYSFLKNDFKYTVPRTKRIQFQKNASVENYGFDQKVRWELGKHNFFFNVAAINNWRQIQPTITSSSTDELGTLAFRSVFTHQAQWDEFSLFNSVGYLEDETTFNEDLPTHSKTFILSNQATMEKEIFDFRIGQISQYSSATSSNFADDLMDWRISLNGSVSYKTSNLKTSINLKQHISRDQAVFSSGLGLVSSIMNTPRLKIEHRFQVNTGFRVPTLNDKFWMPGGNPKLNSERSVGAEMGQNIFIQDGIFLCHIDWNIFYNQVNNWIIWIPSDSSFYAPENLLKVKSRGIELSFGFVRKFTQSTLNFSLSFVGNSSTEESGLLTQIKGSQLPYTPMLQSVTTVQLERKNFSFLIQGRQTGKRYTTLDNTDFDSIPSFFLFKMTLNKYFVLSKTLMILAFDMNNIFDSDYQNLKNRAMPGRNFNLKITTKF